ncbi:MAG: TetR/AcrR family transcriptional regulator [Reyranella sp.]|nr:MAG: TetR/AcrR family transcriptional regulator [Reyranella sp.]
MRTGTETTKRPRGRPRSFDTAEVLERVRGVFLAKGFGGASLDELSEVAGLNRPSLYAAFGDKEQLYIHTLRFYGERSIAALNGVLGGGGTIQQRLAKVYMGSIDLYTAPPDRPGCMIVGTAAVEAPSHPRIAEVAAELLAGIEKSLETAFAASDLPRDPTPAARARMAGAIMYAIAIRARIGIKTSELRAFANAMVPVICR